MYTPGVGGMSLPPEQGDSMAITEETAKVQRVTLTSSTPITLGDLRALGTATRRWPDETTVEFAVSGAKFQPDWVRATFQQPMAPDPTAS